MLPSTVLAGRSPHMGPSNWLQVGRGWVIVMPSAMIKGMKPMWTMGCTQTSKHRERTTPGVHYSMSENPRERPALCSRLPLQQAPAGGKIQWGARSGHINYHSHQPYRIWNCHAAPEAALTCLAAQAVVWDVVVRRAGRQISSTFVC